MMRLLHDIRGMPFKNMLVPVIKGLFIMAGVAWIYFDSLWGLIPGAVTGFYVFAGAVDRMKEQIKREQLMEFKNMIISMQGALEAGKSMEHALIAAGKDMERMYGPDLRIVKEVALIEKKLELKQPFDLVMREFADRMHIEEISDFVDVLITVRRTGGNAVRIIKDTVDRIVEGIELSQELGVMVAAKQLEQMVMTYMPALIILFLRTTNPGFISKLYGNIAGMLFMTVMLGMNVLADHIGRKIVKIM